MGNKGVPGTPPALSALPMFGTPVHCTPKAGCPPYSVRAPATPTKSPRDPSFVLESPASQPTLCSAPFTPAAHSKPRPSSLYSLVHCLIHCPLIGAELVCGIPVTQRPLLLSYDRRMQQLSRCSLCAVMSMDGPSPIYHLMRSSCSHCSVTSAARLRIKAAIVLPRFPLFPVPNGPDSLEDLINWKLVTGTYAVLHVMMEIIKNKNGLVAHSKQSVIYYKMFNFYTLLHIQLVSILL